jgi:hypothetical protein
VSLVLFIYLFIYFYLRSLLILDDVWDPWVLKAFDNQCQILLTTRDKSVTDSVMGKEFLSFFFNLVFRDRVSLCIPGWPRTQKSACLCLPSAGIKVMRHHCLAGKEFQFTF